MEFRPFSYIKTQGVCDIIIMDYEAPNDGYIINFFNIFAGIDVAN